LHRWHAELLRLRANLLAEVPDQCVAFEAQRVLLVRRQERAWMAYSFSPQPSELALPVSPGYWQVQLCSADAEWHGPGRLHSAAELESNGEVRLQLPAYSFFCCSRPTKSRAF